MLSKLIVSSYGTLIEISLWLLLLFAVIAGWQTADFMGAIIGLIGGFIFSTIFMGALLVLEDIRKNVKTIENRELQER